MIIVMMVNYLDFGVEITFFSFHFILSMTNELFIYTSHTHTYDVEIENLIVAKKLI